MSKEQKKNWNPENVSQGVRCYSLKFNKRTDAEILEYLEGVDNFQGFIKELIKERIALKKMAKKVDDYFDGKITKREMMGIDEEEK